MNLYAVAWSFAKGITCYTDSTFEVAISKENALGHSLMRLHERYPVSAGYTGHMVSACLIPQDFIGMVTQEPQLDNVKRWYKHAHGDDLPSVALYYDK